jgi:C4-dicarboxylate-specific signal transduction histidine kinase
MEWNEKDFSAQLEHAALRGELARPMAHEFNNFLNTILIQVAILETVIPEALRTDLAVVSKESKKIAKVIQDWQRWGTRPTQQQPLDINGIVQDALRSPIVEPVAANVVLDLAPGPLFARTAPLPLRQLCVLLLSGIAKNKDARGDAIKVIVRTRRSEGQALLTFIDNGPHLSAQSLVELFDPIRSERAGLEFAVVRNLAEGLEGRLVAENSRDGGLAISFATAIVEP